MKSILKFTAGLLALLFIYTYSFGQEHQPVPLGKAASLVQEFRQPANAKQQQQFVSGAQLKISAASTLNAKVNYRVSGTGEEFMAGEIANTPGSSFFVRVKGQQLEGNIVLRQRQKAYRYYSDSTGNAFVKEVNINEVLCINFEEGPAVAQATSGVSAAAIPDNLQSFPGGNGCILLDYDGQYVAGTPWNNGNPINAAPATLTEAQMLEVWELVAEDFKPFHLNVTTSEAVFNSYPRNRRMRVIFTPTNTAAPGAGGVAYIGSFNWNDDTPCWVFNGGVKGAGDAATHEVGHTFGLGHDGRTSPAEGYYQGHGSWAPIMGVGYYRPVVQWSKGEYTSANNKEDDLAKISSTTYGVGYRADDYGNTIATAAPLGISGGSVNTSGLIGRTADIDVFSFSTSGGTASLTFTPAARHPNLDILVTLYNSSGAVVTTANPSGLPATINNSLAAGTYYVAVTGTGSGNPASDGYSNYGSLGVYTITGTIANASSNAVVTVYQNCEYGGNAVGLAPGRYNMADLIAKGVPNDYISALKVQSGYEAILYEHIDFGGSAYVFRSDFSCLANLSLNGQPLNLNDWTTSLVIQPSTAAAPATLTRAVTEATGPAKTAAAQDVNDKDVQVQLSPNPFRDQLYIKVKNVTEQYYVRVYNVSGTEVRPAQRVTNGQPINLAGMPTGMYLVKIYLGTEVITRKVIKH